MSYLVTIIAFIIVFGVLVTVHEYGHMFLRKEQALCVQNLRSVWDRKFLVLEKRNTLHY